MTNVTTYPQVEAQKPVEPEPETRAETRREERERKRPGRKSNLERHQIRTQLEREQRRAERESKRAVPLLPDTKVSLWIAVSLVGILMASSFTVSFAGTYEVAAFMGLPRFLQWLPPLFLDMAILAYTIALMIFKSRGQSTWRTMSALGGFATLSVAANVSHTLNYWHGDLSNWRVWIGVILTAAAPIAVLLASEEIGRLAFAEPDEEDY